MKPPTPAKPLIIGIGNPYRSDDGIGSYVIDRIRQIVASNSGKTAFDLDTNRGDISTLLDQWHQRQKVMVIDCVYLPDAPCGQIVQFDGLADNIAQCLPATACLSSSHGFSVAEALSLGHILKRLPAQLCIYGINGKCFEAGETLSPGMAEAAEELAGQIVFQPLTRTVITMHEHSLIKNLLHTMAELATQENGAIVGATIQLGALSHISAEHFREHFVHETAGTGLEGINLNIIALDDIHHPLAQDIVLQSLEFAVADEH